MRVVPLLRPNCVLLALFALLALLLLSRLCLRIRGRQQAKASPGGRYLVSDGDSVYVRLDGRDEHVRLIGINCLEISHPDLGIKEQPYGKQAAAYTKKRLLHRKVWLDLDVSSATSMAGCWPMCGSLRR